MKELRTIKRNDEVISFADVKEADIFEMWEPDGKYLGRHKATFDAEQEDGIWGVMASKIEE